MASLQELPDDELDKLFRSSAEEFEPPYNPDDWNSLRRRLDDKDRSRFLDRFIYWGIPGVLLILSVLSLFVKPEEGSSAARIVAENLKSASVKDVAPEFTRQTPSTVSSEPTRAKQTGSATQTPKTSDLAGSTDAVSDPEVTGNTDASTRTGPATPATSVAQNRVSAKPLETKSAVPTPTMSAEKTSSPGPAVRSTRPNPTTEAVAPETGNRLQQTVNRTKAPSRSVVAAVPVRNRSGKSAEMAEGLKPSGTVEDAEKMAGKPAPKNRPSRRSDWRSSEAVPGSDALPPIQGAPESPVSEAATTSPMDLLGNLNAIALRPPARPRLPALPELDLEPMRPPVVPNRVPPAVPVIGYPALSIRVVAAPDFNYVGSSNQAARDLQIGVLGEYRFLRRFTVQSGVLRSVKKYRAAAADYTKPPHWYGPKYESVDAECTVLDIPVNLRFDVMLNDRQRWFVSAGVSSFIMQKEYYEYNYPKGVYPNPSYPQYKQWSGSTGFHTFSHLNFSLGYERNFGSDGPLRRFSWQVEPFLKNPRGATLGYGKIRLTSAGVFFSIRYRL